MKKKLYLGLDIGGTKINAALLCGLKKQRVKVFSLPTPKTKAALQRALTYFLMRTPLRGKVKKLSCIGVGLAGVIDRERGMVVKAANLPWLNGWDIVEFLRRHFRVPIRIDNDVRCFLRAEAAWGVAGGKKNVIGVAIGTGIGGGIMINRQIVYGAHGSAGEFGHMVMQVKREKPAQSRVEGLKARPEPGRGVKSFDWEDLGALQAFKKWGDRSKIIGLGIANLINAFDPEIVVLGGGGVISGGIKLNMVRQIAKRYTINPQARNIPIVAGKLGDAAQVIGAALLFGPK